MKRIILHIGQIKTGSSALQEFLYNNREKLAKQGVCYYEELHIYNGFPGKPNASLWSPDMPYLKERGLDKDVEEHVKEELENLRQTIQKNDTVILSNEAYFVRREVFYERIKNDLGEMTDNPEIKITVYLRRQDEWALSAWKQYVKSSCFTMSFQGFCECEENALRYADKIKTLESVFGKDNINVRIYGKDDFIGGDMAHDFILSNGLQWDNEFSDLSNNTNTSLTIRATNRKRLFNLFIKFAPSKAKIHLLNKARKRAIEISEEKSEPKDIHILSSDERRKFMEQYEEGNSYIAHEYLGRDKLFDDVADGTPVYKEYKRTRNEN